MALFDFFTDTVGERGNYTGAEIDLKETLKYCQSGFSNNFGFDYIFDEIESKIENGESVFNYDIDTFAENVTDSIEVPIYTSELWEWAQSNVSKVNEAMGEFGVSSGDDILKLFALANFLSQRDDFYNEVDSEKETLLEYAGAYFLLEKKKLESVNVEKLENFLTEIVKGTNFEAAFKENF